MNNKKYFVFDLDETLYKLNNDFQIILTVKKVRRNSYISFVDNRSINSN